jgi:nucleoside-diphosphate-sugar epimerase
LTDDSFAYRVMEGVDAVVHLGNHPNLFSGPAPQRLLSENVAMNANVFMAAVDLGVKNLTFSSSIQVILRWAGDGPREPFHLPYLPLDAEAPAAPGSNAYAISKEYAERLLQLLCAEDDQLCATALRFPMLPQAGWVKRLTAAPLPRRALNLGDAMTHLLFPDAANLVCRVVERPRAGYRQYLPGQTTELRGYPLQRIVEEYYSHVPLKRPLNELTALVDCSDLERDLGWKPEHRLSVQLAE